VYKNWWVPVVEEIVIPKRNEKKGENKAASSGQENVNVDLTFFTQSSKFTSIAIL